MDTKFKPLNSGTKFKSTIKFHNLKKVELGALLSSLTFHGHQHEVCHSIGMAKPLGYGKLRVNSCLLKSDSEESSDELMAHFEKQMNIFLGHEWLSSEMIKELFSMGYSNHGVSNEDLSYMKLEMKGPNDFENAKKAKEHFNTFTKQAIRKPQTNSIYEKYREKLDQIEIAKEEERIAELKRIEELRLKEQALAEEVKKQEEEKQKKEKAKLLLESGPTFLSEIADFDRAKGRMDQWLKQSRNELLPEDFHQLLYSNLIRFYNDPKNREKKKWVEPFDKNPIWKKIATWVGNETASIWYNKIINK